MAKRLCKMTSGLADARSWATELIRRESRGPGDMENAMRRLSNRYGIPWRTFWSLKYRPPSDVLVSVYLQLKTAYEAECQRQERLIAHERSIAEAKVLSVETLAQSLDDNLGESRRSAVKGAAVGGGKGQPRGTDRAA
jgi:hypothetical protein